MSAPVAADAVNQAAERVYQRIKDDIFEFRLLPDDRFTESELAARYAVSRTPVRDALYRLKRDGFVDVRFRSGWHVRPFDFARFDELYELRTILEGAAVERLCRDQGATLDTGLDELWSSPPAPGEADPRRVAIADEAFHCALVEAAGNREVALVHAELTEKIRIIRRLDFLHDRRVEATYQEHAQILRLIRRGRGAEALILLRAHIASSRLEVRKITVHMLHEARLAHRAPVGAAAP